MEGEFPEHFLDLTLGALFLSLAPFIRAWDQCCAYFVSLMNVDILVLISGFDFLREYERSGGLSECFSAIMNNLQENA